MMQTKRTDAGSSPLASAPNWYTWKLAQGLFPHHLSIF